MYKFIDDYFCTVLKHGLTYTINTKIPNNK